MYIHKHNIYNILKSSYYGYLLCGVEDTDGAGSIEGHNIAICKYSLYIPYNNVYYFVIQH